MVMFTVTWKETTPFEGQKPGTSGLRKKVMIAFGRSRVSLFVFFLPVDLEIYGFVVLVELAIGSFFLFFFLVLTLDSIRIGYVPADLASIFLLFFHLRSECFPGIF